MHSALRRLDLNLLLVFDALYRHRSVVLAADELALSASAFSHALSRLRAALNDELFLRAAGEMRPTQRAHDLALGVSAALDLLSSKIGDDSNFDPTTSEQTFIFAATDFTTFVFLPPLIARLEVVAPRIRIQVRPSQGLSALGDFAEGAHFVVGFSDEFSSASSELERIEMPQDDYVVVARQGHPRVGGSISLKRYLAERHALVRPWQRAEGVIDAALKRDGHARNVAVEIPSVMVAPFVVARSDLLITLPRQAARTLAQSASVVLLPAPFRTPVFTPTVYFQRRYMHVAWHQWMRNQIVASLSDGPAK